MSPTHRPALDAPAGDVCVLTTALCDEALAHSRSSPRGRVILPFHKAAADPLHRMLNAVQPGSYIRPHRHLLPPKAEAFLVLRGSLAFFVFEDDGRARTCIRLAASSERFGVDVAPGVYHAFVALEPDTLIYEVKNGPYEQANDKEFASWAPKEGSPEAADYVRSLLEVFARADAR